MRKQAEGPRTIAFSWLARMLSMAAVLALGGCVVGQELDLEYQSPEPVASRAGDAVVVEVRDNRPYVKSGDKPPYYIGKYRAGFGIPYDVSTDDDQPLAELVQRDLLKDLSNLGFVATPGVSEGRRLRVLINDWNFDAYQNGRFTYEFLVEVSDAERVLESNKVSDAVYVKGSFWTGGKGGFERAMPDMYRDAIEAIVRENPEILSSLRPE